MVPPTCQFVQCQDATGRDFSACNLTKPCIMQGKTVLFLAPDKQIIHFQTRFNSSFFFPVPKLPSSFFIIILLNNSYSCFYYFLYAFILLYFSLIQLVVLQADNQVVDYFAKCFIKILGNCGNSLYDRCSFKKKNPPNWYFYCYNI